MTANTRLTAEEEQDCLDLNPFDGDFGAPGDITFSDRICVARKPAVCNDCSGQIQPKEQQRRLEAKFDGQLRVYRWCNHCCRAMALSWVDDGAALQTRWDLRKEREEAARREAA